MSSIYAFVATEQLDLMEILAHQRPELWDVIDRHGPLASHFSKNGDQFVPSATGISTAHAVYTAPEVGVHLTGTPLVDVAADVIA